jgi:hypothetical protein
MWSLCILRYQARARPHRTLRTKRSWSLIQIWHTSSRIVWLNRLKLPSGWEHIPFLCLPDGVHKVQQDSTFFTVADPCVPADQTGKAVGSLCMVAFVMLKDILFVMYCRIRCLACRVSSKWRPRSCSTHSTMSRATQFSKASVQSRDWCVCLWLLVNMFLYGGVGWRPFYGRLLFLFALRRVSIQ